MTVAYYILYSEIIYCRTIGWLKRFTGSRRSRKVWPCYDNAYLWHGEEAYEYNHSGSIDEYMDVLGTIMILQEFHGALFNNRVRKIVPINRITFKRNVILWWLKQHKRGRPNLSLLRTYKLFRAIHFNLIKDLIF